MTDDELDERLRAQVARIDQRSLDLVSRLDRLEQWLHGALARLETKADRSLWHTAKTSATVALLVAALITGLGLFVRG